MIQKNINMQVGASSRIKVLENQLKSIFRISDRTLLLQGAIKLVQENETDWVEVADSYSRYKLLHQENSDSPSTFNYQANLSDSSLASFESLQIEIYNALRQANKLKRLSKPFALSLILFQAVSLSAATESAGPAEEPDIQTDSAFVKAPQLMAILTEMILADPLLQSPEISSLKEIMLRWKAKNP